MRLEDIRTGMRIRVVHVRRNNKLYGKGGVVESATPTPEGWILVWMDDGRRVWLEPEEIEPEEVRP